jgi:hypothetical protein
VIGLAIGLRIAAADAARLDAQQAAFALRLRPLELTDLGALNRDLHRPQNFAFDGPFSGWLTLAAPN